MVKEKLKEYNMILNERRQMLRDILEFEGMQFEEELILLLNKKLDEQFQKRLDWINAASMEQAKAEEELLKLKNQQRELENCEEWRHMQSKQLLLETKEAQLLQIEEKKMRSHKEKQIEKEWLKVMERLNQEREHQEIYEYKLRKVIEGSNQRMNQDIDHSNKMRQHLEMEQRKEDEHEENQRLLFMQEKQRQEGKLKEILKRTRQDELLKSQISSNYSRKCMEFQESLNDGLLQKNLEDENILLELTEAKRQNIRNKEWHKLYLEVCLKEKAEKSKEKRDYDRIYLNTGCVLQQQPKKPYGKNVR